MAAKFEKTRYPGIYKRGSRYVITWEHRGKQHKESFRTLPEAREAKGKRDSGEKRPKSRVRSATTSASGSELPWPDLARILGDDAPGVPAADRGPRDRAVEDVEDERG